MARSSLVAAFVFGSALGTVTLGTGACGFDNAKTADAGAGGGEGGVAENGEAGASVQGAGCGTESSTGTQLCAATSMCPNLVVDTQTFPNCGFRIRGSVVDLVCVCNTALCPMGAFNTCAQASELLQNQTQAGVCVQVAEGRCSEIPTGSSSGSNENSSGGSGCDRQCVQECGGGEGCAQLCNCS